MGGRCDPIRPACLLDLVPLPLETSELAHEKSPSGKAALNASVLLDIPIHLLDCSDRGTLERRMIQCPKALLPFVGKRNVHYYWWGVNMTSRRISDNNVPSEEFSHIGIPVDCSHMRLPREVSQHWTVQIRREDC
jgi:hypothetical protein